MFTGYRIRSIFLLVLLFLFSILIFFFYKEFYTLIIKDPLLGIILVLILCGYISYLQFNLGCRIIITLTKGIPHFLHIPANKDNMLLFLGFMIYNLFLVYFSISILCKTNLLLYWYDSTLFDLFFINNLLISTVLLSAYLRIHYEGYSLTMSQKYKIGNGLLIRSFILLMPLIVVLGAYYSDFDQFNLFNVVNCDSVDYVLPGPDNSNNQGGRYLIINRQYYNSIINVKLPNNFKLMLDMESQILNNSYWNNIRFFHNLLANESDPNRQELIVKYLHMFIHSVKHSTRSNHIIIQNMLKHPDLDLRQIFNFIPVYYNGSYQIGSFFEGRGVEIYYNAYNRITSFNDFYSTVIRSDNSYLASQIYKNTDYALGSLSRSFTGNSNSILVDNKVLLYSKGLLNKGAVVYYSDIRTLVIGSQPPVLYLCDSPSQFKVIERNLFFSGNTSKHDIFHKYLENWENNRVKPTKYLEK